MEHLKNLIRYCKDKDPSRAWPRASDEVFVHIENTLLPHLLRVLQKDKSVFAEIELFPGIKIDDIWDNSDEAWKLIHMALLYSVLHGDPKEKFGRILEAVKGLVPGGSDEHTSQINSILEDEETQSSLKEMLDLIVNTRLASIVGDIAQSIQFADLGIDFENPEALLQMMRNPTENPALKELMERAQAILEDRIKSGRINQQELVREIEMIRAKFQSAFGKYINEMVVGDAGGGTTGNTSAQILSHHPDARRARMLARLQKKQKLRK